MLFKNLIANVSRSLMWFC